MRCMREASEEERDKAVKAIFSSSAFWDRIVREANSDRVSKAAASMYELLESEGLNLLDSLAALYTLTSIMLKDNIAQLKDLVDHSKEEAPEVGQREQAVETSKGSRLKLKGTIATKELEICDINGNEVEELDFGEVYRGGYYIKQIAVRNIGRTDLELHIGFDPMDPWANGELGRVSWDREGYVLKAGEEVVAAVTWEILPDAETGIKPSLDLIIRGEPPRKGKSSPSAGSASRDMMQKEELKGRFSRALKLIIGIS
ncbi:MAG: hypothetical protein ACP5JF_08325 [Candidatus Methanodesulfokora sp.]